jgi:hypothetical protein
MKLNILKWIVPAALLGITALPIAAQAQPYHESINSRLHNQHARIGQGFEHSQLNGRQVYRLSRRDAQIHRQEHRDRRFDNGHLTYGERRNLNRELNRESGTIYRDRH